MSEGGRFRILGPLDGGPGLDVGGRKQRELLAVLLLDLNRAVPASRLVDALWQGDPPGGAEVTLRSHISHLRRRLSAVGLEQALVTGPAGYGLFVDPDDVDATRFERLVGLGQEALGLGDAPKAAELLREALDLWRGPVLDDLGQPEFATAEAARLEALRLTALEARVDADLALGRHHDLIPELERLVAEHPFRERLCGQLVLALYRAGRQVDALAALADVRRRLADDLGLDPGPALAELETSILRHDRALLLEPAPVRAAVEPPPDALFATARRRPMIGRVTELARLEEAARDGGFVFLSGEAGVGKTRLVAEFAARASATGAGVLVGRCDPLAATPYAPITAALRTSLPAAADQRALFDEVSDRLAAAAPAVLVIEDAERIDAASAALLRHLARGLPADVLVVIGFRDPPGTRHGPLLDLLADVRHADRLSLGPLSEQDVAALAKEYGVADEAAVEHLWRSTGGNPFFAIEVLRAGGHRLPSGVRDVVRHRLSALPKSARQAVCAAALLGGEVSFDLLAEALDRSEDDLVDDLEQAVAAGFLVEAGQSWTGSYAFPHDLMREALAGEVPLVRRRRLHLRAGEALLASGDPGAAAAHLRAAGPAADPGHTADISLRAADAAARLYAWDDAIEHAEAAVTLLERAGGPALASARMRTSLLRVRAGIDNQRAVQLLEDALRDAAGDPAVLGQVHSRLGGTLCTHHSVFDIPRALDHFAAAERLGVDSFHLHRGKAQAAMYAVRTDVLGAAARRSRELAEQAGRRDLGVFAQWAAAWWHVNRGEVGAAMASWEEGWAATTEIGDPYVGWGVVNAAGLFANAYLLDPALGRAWSRRGLAQGRFSRFVHPHATVLDQLVLAQAEMGELAAARSAATALPEDAVGRRMLLFLSGNWEAAEAAWAAALANDEAHGDRHDAALHARWLATVRRLLGDVDGAVRVLRAALVTAVDGPQVPTELAVRAELARLLPAEAAAHLTRCDEILAGGEDWRGLVGLVQMGHGDFAGAADTFARVGIPWRRAEALHALHAEATPLPRDFNLAAAE